MGTPAIPRRRPWRQEYQLLSHEEQRRTAYRGGGAPSASTAELKQFLVRLQDIVGAPAAPLGSPMRLDHVGPCWQDIASSPSLRTLSLTESRARSERSDPPMGGANIRRLQAEFLGVLICSYGFLVSWQMLDDVGSEISTMYMHKLR